MKECCYKSVFGGQLVRNGRCNYSCLWCNGDVSMLWAFYSLAQHEKERDDAFSQERQKELLNDLNFNS